IWYLALHQMLRLMKKVLLVSVFVYLFAHAGFAQNNKLNCEATCFQSEIIKAEKDEAGCLLYEIKVSYQGTKCTPALSHYTVAIPCGEIKDLSNSQDWKQEFGTDPKTGLSGFKIDNIP